MATAYSTETSINHAGQLVMTQSIQHDTHAYIGAFIDELVRCGVKHACICPGSRSTPLAMMFAQNPNIKVWMQLDERSGAFFALGLAKSLTEPVVLVCTSGSAAANFFPAVVEAYHARVPLIVLTADRPPELHGIGAPQTIDQNRIYGSHVKWFVDVALPESSPDMLRYVSSIADRATTFALTDPIGPIHLNFPFREPLVPLPADAADNTAVSVSAISEPKKRQTEVMSGLRDTDLIYTKALAVDLSKIQRGLIICGPQRSYELGDAIARLAEALGYPVLADGLSQLRAGQHENSTVITTYDAFLRDPAFVEKVQPDVVIRFGRPPTSKPLNQYLQKYANARQILVDGGGGWNDPSLIATEIVHAESSMFCENLVNHLGALRRLSEVDNTWLNQWIKTDLTTRAAMSRTIDSFKEMFEGRVYTELANLLPDNATVYVSSSMPVRDLDTFFPNSERIVRILSNRGANGIDGVVSSAMGTAASHDGPTVLIIGDLAMYHDMNGLLAGKLHKLNLTIVLINNDGGGIFSFLPQAAYPEHFELLYGTPHGLDFSKMAALYDANYCNATDWDVFRTAVKQGIQSGGVQIVEVKTKRDLNVTQHREIWKAVAQALAEQ
jgi:2-succinyl-5-enolpyruvyl-6-hydroxy-3-cyclohexene-1-carboxylate synthase